MFKTLLLLAIVFGGGTNIAADQPPPPVDIVEEDCIDVAAQGEAQCREWAMTGECHNNPAFMSTNCRKSCGLCENQNNDVAVVGTEPCVNLAKEGDRQCREWAWFGECETNSEFMHNRCRKACGLCQPLVDDEDGVCEDAFPKKCPEWKEEGHCFGQWEAQKGPHGINNAYVIEFCPQSCGVCDIHLDERDWELNIGVAPQVSNPNEVGDIPIQNRIKARMEETRQYISTLPEDLQSICKLGHPICARLSMSEDCTEHANEDLIKYHCAAACQTCESWNEEDKKRAELVWKEVSKVHQMKEYMAQEHKKNLKEEEKENVAPVVEIQ